VPIPNADKESAVRGRPEDRRSERLTAKLVPEPGDDLVPEQGDNSVVRFGYTVTVVGDDGQQTFGIVEEDEADPSRGTISHLSPLEQASFGKRAGDVVSVVGGDAEVLSIC
jgi:transcription elongation GreA/GreB family factor